MTDILPDFQKFLTDRKLAPSARIPFYALWVNKFLSYSNNHQDKNLNLRINMFLDHFEKGKDLMEWQVEQADDVIRLYINHFLSGVTASLSPNREPGPLNIFLDYQTVRRNLREAIRIKHYAYSTERSYIEWFRRFHSYVTDI